MARRKKWFITGLYDLGIGPAKAADIFSATGMRAEVAEVLVKRFWHGLGIKELEGIVPGYEQNRCMAKWDSWVRSWALEHPEMFQPDQFSRLIEL